MLTPERAASLAEIGATASGSVACTRLLASSVGFATGLLNLQSMPFLTSVDISHNRLVSLDGLGVLHQLSRLDASHNRLQAVLDFAVASRAGSGLRFADLHANEIIGAIGMAADDNACDDASSTASTVLLGVTAHPRLETLQLDENALTSTRGADALPALITLSLRSNGLEEVEVLPPRIRSLDLSENRLSEVPRSVIHCATLRTLWLAGNPIDVHIGHGTYATAGTVVWGRDQPEPQVQEALRFHVMRAMPSLRTLDGTPVTSTQKVTAVAMGND